MEQKIKCRKCGHLNYKEPEGQCENCGEYLYQYYTKQRTKKYLILSSTFVLITILVVIIISYLPVLKKKSEPIDPVRRDLIEYMKKMDTSLTEISNSDVRSRYIYFVQGDLNEEEKSSILKKLNMTKEPSYEETEKMDKYIEECDKLSNIVVKNRSKLVDRMKIQYEYCSLQENIFRNIVPITKEVEDIHDSLIKSREYCKKSYDNFVTGVKLGYILNIKEERDGSVRWSYFPRNKEYSENYISYRDRSKSESDRYKKKIEQLIKIKKMSEEKNITLGISPNLFLIKIKYLKP